MNPVQLLYRVEILNQGQWSFVKSVVASWGLVYSLKLCASVVAPVIFTGESSHNFHQILRVYDASPSVKELLLWTFVFFFYFLLLYWYFFFLEMVLFVF